jgi:hypothetical protein
MKSFNLWRAVDPLPTEIQAAQAAFEGLDLRDNNILPRLIMVRRAVAASFYSDYSDDLRGLAHASWASPGLAQSSSAV